MATAVPATARIATLTAELRTDSDFVAVPRPRLSWTVDAADDEWMQERVELRSGDELVTLDTRDSVLVDWPFAPLAPGEERTVAVRATSEGGAATAWSEPLRVISAEVAAWRARPIGLADPAAPASPALLRTEFELDRPVARALLHWTAFGVADLELNGQATDDGVMGPGWTSYDLRLVHETSDVTELLVEGRNALGVRLAGGWYTEEYAIFTAPVRVWGEQPRVIAQLELEFADGTRQTVVTDDTWRATGEGRLRSSGIYAGEHFDARRELRGWSASGYDDSAWSAVVVDERELPLIEPRMAPPVRVVETIGVQAVLTTPSGATVLDFGQNLVGRLRIRVSGPAGTEITLRHAEVLENGELAVRQLRRATQVDRYVLGGTGDEEWAPRFTFHGFRYAQIDGWPGDLDPAAVTAEVLQTDMARTGWFTSSDAMLDRLHENAVWSWRGNALSIPMDCPQRDERMGWAGDLQLFTPAASTLLDSSAFIQSWLRDLRLEQIKNGGLVPVMAPNAVPGFAERHAIAAWSDAIVIIPRVLRERYGDDQLIAQYYPAMRDWAEVLLRSRDDDGLWTRGRQLGDWLDPAAPPHAPQQAKTDADLVAAAYLVRTLRQVAELAAELGHADDAQRYGEASEFSRRAFLDAYVTPAGRVLGDSQTGYALALSFELISDPAQRAGATARLAVVVRRDGYRVATGLVGTPIILDTLLAGGHLDVAERLLFQTECPSWLYPVTVGATTMWERWDSLLPDGSVNPGSMTSFNHYIFGSVVDWLHRAVAGLSPAEPGYRRLRIAPHPLSRLDRAESRHETPYGLASSGWVREGTVLRVTAIVPPNTRAEVVLPGQEPFEVGSGRHEWTVPAPAETPTRPPLTVESPTAALIDDERAYRAALALLRERNPRLEEGFRTRTAWSAGRAIRDALIFASPELLAELDALLRAETAAP